MEKMKKANYGKETCVATENGVVFFDPKSQKDVVGAERMTYDEYLDVQLNSKGKVRTYFECCYFNIPMGFAGQIEKVSKDNICFKRIYVSGMFPDGVMFDGKEDHVWMSKEGFEKYKVGDCLEFHAEIYRYVKTSNGKQIDYSLRNPKGIKHIEAYELPSDDALLMQGIREIICETCMLYDNCNRTYCMMDPNAKRFLQQSMFKAIKGSKK